MVVDYSSYNITTYIRTSKKEKKTKMKTKKRKNN